MKNFTRLVGLGLLAVSSLVKAQALPPDSFYNTFPGVGAFSFYGNQEGDRSLAVCTGLDTPSNAAACHKSFTQNDPATSNTNGVDGSVGSTAGGGSIVRGALAYDPYGGSADTQWMSFTINTGNYFSANPNAHIAIGARAFLPPEGYGDAYAFNSYGTYPNTQTKLPHAYGDGIILGQYGDPSNSCGSPATVRGVLVEHFFAPYGSYGVETNQIGNCHSNVFLDNHDYSVRVAVQTFPYTYNGYTGHLRNITFQVVDLATGQTAVQDLAGTSFLDAVDYLYRPPQFWGWTFFDGAGRPAYETRERVSWFLADIFTVGSVPWSFRISNLQVATASGIPPRLFQ